MYLCRQSRPIQNEKLYHYGKTNTKYTYLPRRVISLVYEWLDLRKEELLANWANIENGKTLVEIEPLD